MIQLSVNFCNSGLALFKMNQFLEVQSLSCELCGLLNLATFTVIVLEFEDANCC